MSIQELKGMSRPDTTSDKRLKPFFEALEKLFAAMNEKYDQVASYYGFKCNGCDDNCCKTRFYHHTYLEFFYLKKGVDSLDQDIKRQMLDDAARICHVESKNPLKADDRPKIMCPANLKGRCVIYVYRPMICRLHGVPSEWTFPAGTGTKRTVVSSGCEEFNRQCQKKDYKKFDRTPFYMEMSFLEKKFKEHFGFNQKIKMTVAQIIASGIGHGLKLR